MKNVYLIGGTMGVGKTASCNILMNKLDHAVFLDGDWCWTSDPFQVTNETKKMVLNDIFYVLNSFIHCPAYQNIVFCWVMHEQSIIDSILSRLDTAECNIKNISLVCNTGVLTESLRHDIDRGIRQPDIIERSLDRISLYDSLNTIKIDTSNMTVLEVAKKIASC